MCKSKWEGSKKGEKRKEEESEAPIKFKRYIHIYSSKEIPLYLFLFKVVRAREGSKQIERNFLILIAVLFC